MSLPSIAIIRQQDGTEIARPFINCGWFVNAASLARSFMFGIREWNEDVEWDALVDTDTIEMYGEILTVGLLRKMKDQEQLQRFFEVKWAAEKEINNQLKDQDDTTSTN